MKGTVKSKGLDNDSMLRIADYLTYNILITQMSKLASQDLQRPNSDATEKMEGEMQKRMVTNATFGLVDLALIGLTFTSGLKERPSITMNRLIQEFYKLGATRLEVEGRVFGREFWLQNAGYFDVEKRIKEVYKGLL